MFGTMSSHSGTGQRPYGALPGERQILGHIRNLSRSGMSPYKIAQTLNSLGFLTRTGRLWVGGTVHAILKRDPDWTKKPA